MRSVASLSHFDAPQETIMLDGESATTLIFSPATVRAFAMSTAFAACTFRVASAQGVESLRTEGSGPSSFVAMQKKGSAIRSALNGGGTGCFFRLSGVGLAILSRRSAASG